MLDAVVRADVSERSGYTESLEHQALHDGLIGLAKRRSGRHGLQALASAKRNVGSRAVLVVDLDGFKQVNDRLGRDHGDVLLEEVAKRLVDELRENDAIAASAGTSSRSGDRRPTLSGNSGGVVLDVARAKSRVRFSELDRGDAGFRRIGRLCVWKGSMVDVGPLSAAAARFSRAGSARQDLLGDLTGRFVQSDRNAVYKQDPGPVLVRGGLGRRVNHDDPEKAAI